VSPPPFQTFLDGHRDAVYRFLVFSVGPDDADDCLQETFTAALRSYPRLEDGSNLRAWVLTIAHRKAIDAHRGRARRPVPSAELPETPAPAVTLPDPGLWDAVGKLAPKQRASIVLRFVSDLPFRQVGRILDISEAAARQNVHEGIAHLRKEYADDEH
jgi:DNA-directed RNA polymerase specialized sigma24 family protein